MFAKLRDAPQFETARRLAVLQLQEDLPPGGKWTQGDTLDERSAHEDALIGTLAFLAHLEQL